MRSVTREPRLVTVVGATAAGKTRLAVQMAHHLDGELVNADSRQAIRELGVGVCKPTAAELEGVPCHGLDWRRLGDRFTAADFVDRARPILESIWARGRTPLVVGGTGLYVRALVGGFDFGRAPTPVGAGPQGGAEDVEWLRTQAPDLAATVDLRNPRRVARAVVLATTGRRAAAAPNPWVTVQVGCGPERGELRRRIELRSRELVGEKLALEIDALRQRGYSDQVIAAAAIGYREAMDWMSGVLGREAAGDLVGRRTWKYARQQLTWWRREVGITWVDTGDDLAVERALAAVERPAQ